MLSFGTPDVAQDFLESTKEKDPLRLFRSYARHLLRSSEALKVPVPLENIRDRHGFRRQGVPLPQRGFLLGNTIFVNGDDISTVQRFTEAHEFMEALFIAIRTEDLSRFPKEFSMNVWPDKECWCECGAAEILMPEDLFFPHVREMGVSFTSARTLADYYHTSLTATIRRMLETDTSPCIFLLLKEGHKKFQQVPSRDGQLVLWGNPKDFDPPAELRVWRNWSSPQVTEYVCNNESLSRDTWIYQALVNKAGETSQGWDELDMEYIKGTYRTESMKVTIDSTAVIMALIHL